MQATRGASRIRQLIAIHAIQGALTGGGDLRAGLQVAADELRKVLQVQACQIYVSPSSAAELELVASSGTPLTSVAESDIQPGQAFARRAITQAPLLYIRDLRRGDDVEARDLLLSLDLRSCIGTPLGSAGQVFGAIVAFARQPITPDTDTIHFIETVAGQAAIAVDVARLRDELRSRREAPSARGRKDVVAPSGLTESQLAILHLVVGGRSNRQIAQAVHLSENTVKFHVREIFRKWNARNRVEAAMAAVRRGIL